MASSITNKGKAWILETVFRKQRNGSGTLSDRMYIALVIDDNVPNADDTTWADLSGTDIAAGNGYTAGGQALDLGTTDFDTVISDADADTNDYGYIRLKDISWTASGGSIPASGEGAAYAVLMDNAGSALDNNANKLIAWWDLGGARSVSSGQTLSLQDLEIRLT